MPVLSAVPAAAFELLATALAPPRCSACDASVPWLTVFCSACASTAQRAPAGDTRSVTAFVYGGAVARAITRMKYERRPDLGRPLGDLLWGAVAPLVPSLQGSVVVPVPLHPSRLAERGYNQSALVARRLARGLRAPLWPRALARTRDTPRQTTLARETRLANVAGAFMVREPEHVRGRRVILVDDVWTTGATLDGCAEALHGAGVALVTRAVVARAGY